MTQSMSRKRVSRLMGAAVVAGLACAVLAQPASQAPLAPAAPVAPTPPASTTPSVDAIELRIQAQAREMAAMQRAIDAKQRALQLRTPGAPGAPGGGGGGMDPAMSPYGDAPMTVITGEGSLRSSGSPALVVTSELSDSQRAAWTEDLTVMNKLVREAVSGGDGDSGMIAMGIHVKSVSFDFNQPFYLEGAGVLLTAKTDVALATSGAPTTALGTEPEVESAWERARRELKGPSDHPKFRRTPALPVFDQAKLDGLIESIMTLLPEATNMRQLKDDEFVYITVIGIDDAGVPRRLNLKASKSDIDQAASGAISPETFRQRVASNID